MNAVKSVNLAVRFLLELCVLAAFGYWGFTVSSSQLAKISLGVGVPLLAAIIWGTFIAPKAPIKLATPARVVVELVIFALAVAALWAAGRPAVAWSFAGLVVVNEVLLLAWGQ